MPRQMPRYGISRRVPRGTPGSCPPSRVTRTARHEDAVDLVELADGLFVRHVLGVEPAHLHPAALVHAGVLERFVHREVRVVELHVLADERDLDDVAPRLDPLRELVPLRQVGLPRVDPELLAHERVQPFLLEQLRYQVHVRHVGRLTTAPVSTSAKRAIFSRMSAESSSRERQTTTSGWMPIRRSSFTECWVGFVFARLRHRGRGRA